MQDNSTEIKEKDASSLPATGGSSINEKVEGDFSYNYSEIERHLLKLLDPLVRAAHKASADEVPVCRSKFSHFKNGIVNPGLSCYINVVLQALLRCAGFREHFFYNLHLRDAAGTRDLKDSLSEKLAEFVKIYFAFNEKILDPFELRADLGRRNKAFDSSTQEDAHEFLLFLLDALGHELRRGEPLPSPEPIKPQSAKKEEQPDRAESLPFEEQSCSHWAQELLRNNSVLQDVFLGQYVSKVVCSECAFNSASFQAFNVLELPVPAKQEASLRDCFALFTQQETLECGLWRCPKCQKKVRASKHINLSVLPPVLVICLKRFGMKDGAAFKSNCLVRTDLEGEDLRHLLDADSSARESTVYLPFAFVVAESEQHHSGNQHAGHYTCSIRRCLDAPQQAPKWITLDDHLLKEIPLEKSSMVRAAQQFNSPLNYLIFFQRQHLSAVCSLANPHNWPFSKEVIGKVLAQLPDCPATQRLRQLSTAKISLRAHSLSQPAARFSEAAVRSKAKTEDRGIKVFAKWPVQSKNRQSRVSDTTPATATAEKKETDSDAVRRSTSQQKRQAGVKISKFKAS